MVSVASLPAESSVVRSLQPLTLAAALAGVATIAAYATTKSRSRSAIARQVTRQDIKNLKITDIPDGWRPKISVGMVRRDKVCQAIARKFEDTFFVMAFNNAMMEAPQLEAARAMFPTSVTCRNLKNTLVRRATLGTGWEAWGEELRGSNMFVFVSDEEDVKATVKSYLSIEKKFARKTRIAELNEKVGGDAKFEFKPLIGGCLRDEWNFIPPEDFPKLKDFPTKLELIGKIAGSVKQVTQKLAVAINQTPQKLAIGTKKIVEKMEEDSKATVADVVA